MINRIRDTIKVFFVVFNKIFTVTVFCNVQITLNSQIYQIFGDFTEVFLSPRFTIKNNERLLHLVKTDHIHIKGIRNQVRILIDFKISTYHQHESNEKIDNILKLNRPASNADVFYSRSKRWILAYRSYSTNIFYLSLYYYFYTIR